MLRVGIVGTGLIAREHARAIALIAPRVTLVAAADISPERRDSFRREFPAARGHATATALIDDPGVDLVTIATPPASHETAVVAALEAGKYVLCEKPLAHSLASAARIADASERHPGRLSVSYQMRYHPGYRRLVWLCRNGALGMLQTAVLARHGQTQGGGWWGAWETAGGGVLLTQLIHEVDILLQAMGPAQSISAVMDTRYTRIESEDHLEATIQFANGATAVCSASVNSGRPGGQFRIIGRDGAADPSGFFPHDPRNAGKVLSALDSAVPGTRPASQSRVSGIARRVGARLGAKPKPEPTPHARLYLDIAGAVERRGSLPIPASDAMASLELCMAAYQSALTGSPVSLPLGRSSEVFEGVRKAAYDVRPGRTITVRQPASSSIRIGLVGLDTSHATTFTKLLHDPYDPLHIPGARVVAAYAGGSPDMAISASRVASFTAEVRDRYGVPIVDSPEQVADASDVVLVLASDGRTHPALFRAVAGRGKPIFVDKPFAVSVDDAQEIFGIAAETNTRVFASSAFRYADGLAGVLQGIRERGERVRTCHVQCWLPIEPTQGRYFWYGIHAAEMLVSCMGAGISEVEAAGSEMEDRITVRHADGRQSMIAGSRVDGAFRVRLATDAQDWDIDLGGSMGSLSARLLRTVLDVLAGEQAPRLWRATLAGSIADRSTRLLDPIQDETLEVIALLSAAQQSHERGGTVALARDADRLAVHGR